MQNQTVPPSASGQPYKRSVRNILIHRPMQREFTLVITAMLMISIFAVGFIIHDTIRDAAFGGGFQFGKINPYEVLGEVRYELILKISTVLFVTLIILALFGVFFLHRVAGPVHRFRQVFIRLNNGHAPTNFKIRDGDFFVETAQEINQYLSLIQTQENQKRQIIDRLQHVLSSNPNLNSANELRQIKQDLEHLTPKA